MKRELGPGTIFLVVLLAGLFARSFLVDGAIIRGRSMLPELADGDVVFYFKAAYGAKGPFARYLIRWALPRVGDIVVARRPDTGTVIVKRVATASLTESGDSQFELIGDNYYESVDSRVFGPVPMNNILGEALRFPRFSLRSRP